MKKEEEKKRNQVALDVLDKNISICYIEQKDGRNQMIKIHLFFVIKHSLKKLISMQQILNFEVTRSTHFYFVPCGPQHSNCLNLYK